MSTGNEILRQVNKGNIIIDPFNPDHLGPNSYDLTSSLESSFVAAII